ncbi:hypothetical protein POI8812_00166 [Pontivivens insulae]|uniref:Uncharacterized protein n=1 Tax=Pontivivens insulae TaxID=1639689 RepID=A0A2R8A6J8_9RHOB|nr:hypothetical protein POI8812_00166 [Pontivivens insulae]
MIRIGAEAQSRTMGRGVKPNSPAHRRHCDSSCAIGGAFAADLGRFGIKLSHIGLI